MVGFPVVFWQDWKNLNMTAFLLGMFATTYICFMLENFLQSTGS